MKEEKPAVKSPGTILSSLLLFSWLLSISGVSATPQNNSSLDYYRRALWQNIAGVSAAQTASQNYGAVSSIFQRMDDALNSAQRSLNNTDYYDFQSRLYSLKQSAQLELSRGADASVLMQPAQSLELEISSRIRESGQQSGNKKAQMEMALERLDSAFRNKKDELSEDERNHFQDMINALFSRSQQSIVATDDGLQEKLKQEASELESTLMDRILFGPKARNGIKYTRTESPFDKQKAETTPLTEIKTPSSSSQREQNSESARPNTAPKAPKKPPVPIPKMIEQIENSLIDFHEKHQIGSFDMDSFTEKLLAEKRNLHVMMSKTGRISARQEALVRQELEKLSEDINNRVLGKD